MNPAFTYNTYVLKRQFLALTGRLRVYDSRDQLALFVEQKMFRLKEDIRAYDDENKSREMLLINARTIIDFSAAYDVVDPSDGRKVGSLRRKGLKSIFRDEWIIMDENDRQIGTLFEDNVALAMVRRLLLGSLLPQNYDMTINGVRVADLRQRFNPFVYHLDIDFSMDAGNILDRRLGMAAAILLAIIERRQE